MAHGIIKLQVIFTNPEALEALQQSLELAQEITEDAPWNCEAKELLEKLQIAAGQLGAVPPSVFARWAASGIAINPPHPE